MGGTYSIPKFSKLLAKKTSSDPDLIETSLKEIFPTIEHCLREHGKADIQLVGTLELASEQTSTLEDEITSIPDVSLPRDEAGYYERVILPEPLVDSGAVGGQTATATTSGTSVLNAWIKRLEIGEKKGKQLWNQFWTSVIDVLFRHMEVVLPEFGSFQVKGVDQSEIAGKMYDSVRTVMMNLEDTFLDGEETSNILFEPSDYLIQKLDLEGGGRLIFFEPSRDETFREVLENFSKYGWNVKAPDQADEVLALMEEAQDIPVMVVDTTTDEGEQLFRKLKTRRTFADTRFVTITDDKGDPERPKQFIVLGDEVVQKPYDPNQLLQRTNRVLQKKDQRPAEQLEVRHTFPTMDEWVDEAYDYTERLIGASGIDEENQIKLKAVFREAIGNAIQHGNRYRRDKQVKCRYRLDDDQISFRVEDEGRGFDWEKYIERSKSDQALSNMRRGHEEGKYGGFGIMLMIRTVDDVEYNGNGNAVHLIKHLEDEDRDTEKG